MSLRQDILDKMQSLSIQPKKSLGQNFLIDENVVEKIFTEVKRINPAMIVEVGPGLGTLTESLIQKKWPHMLIELDRQMAAYWRERGEKVYEADALKMQWDSLNVPGGTLLLSNLPYQIASRLVIDRSVDPQNIEHMVLMFQKEVAQRLTAVPRTKDYGFLSVITQTYWQVEKLVDVSPEGFMPVPKVASRVLRFQRRKGIQFDPQFLQFMKSAFQFRRKYLLKNIKGNREGIIQALQQLGYSDKARSEEISPTEFYQFYKMIAVNV